MNEHDQFKEMCALYASGVGSETELREFEEHLVGCEDCHERVTDFMAIHAQALGPRVESYPAGFLPRRGIMERFIETLRREGVVAAKPVRTWVWPAFSLRFSLLTAGAAAAAFSIVLLTPGISRYLESKKAHETMASNNVANAPVTSSVSIKTPPSPETSPNTSQEKLQAEHLQAQLASVQTDKEVLQQKNAAMGAELQSVLARDEQFASRVSALERDNQNLRQEQQKTGAQLSTLNDQLKKKDSDEMDTVATLAERQTRINDLTAQLANQDAELSEQKRLLDASSQARDLIVARNLHIVDVHDNIGAEHRQRAFGRIFYTEGKSLVFYAYDLADPGNLNAKVTFHLWGENLEGEQHPKKLGIFRNEDPSQGRWVLTFDDPKVLARVNTVFVTAESAKKDIDQPKGKRILFAFLGSEPNHP